MYNHLSTIFFLSPTHYFRENSLPLLFILGTVSLLFAPPIPSAVAQSVQAWNPNVSCGAVVTTFQNVTGSSGALSTPWQTSSTTGGVPNKRALSPPCTITNVNGQTVSTLVQINGIYLPHLTYGDCSTTYNSVNGGGSYPDRNGDGKADSFCDDYGDIHSIVGGSTAIHIEFDQDWLAKGYCGPGHSPCDNRTITQYFSTGSVSLDVQGFVYWDAGHWELHPFTAWKPSSSPQPLTTSFVYSPSNPSPNATVSFTGTATGGTGPYVFNWNFGDSGQVTGNPTTHSYSSPGSYTVKLTTTDSRAATATSSRIVGVGSQNQTMYKFNPTDDTYVEQDTPTSNYGTSTEITTDTSPVKDILIKFNVQVTGQITSATLRLYQIDASDKGGNFHTVPGSWTESNATWNNAPSADPATFYSLGPVTTNTWYNVSMTSLVTGNGIVSLRVTSSSPTGDGSHFASKENSGGAFAPQLIILTTSSSSSNTAPTLSVPSVQNTNEQAFLGFTVLATDDSSQTITLTSSGLPSGASFTSTPTLGSVSGMFSWTPSEAQGPGNYTVAFTATDNGSPMLSTSRTVFITVSEINIPPVISAPSSVTATVNTTTSFSVSATDSDLPMNTITLSGTGLVQGMSFPTVTGNPASGTFTFSPDSAQLGTTFNITFTAIDTGSPTMSTTKSILITVKQASPPTFTSLSWSKRVSLSHTGNTQTWTSRITNPNPNLALWVNVRIVGSDTTGRSTFTANSGPILVPAGQTVTITVSQSFDSSTVGLSFNFTAQLDWGYSSNGLSQLSTSTQKGTFKIAA